MPKRGHSDSLRRSSNSIKTHAPSRPWPREATIWTCLAGFLSIPYEMFPELVVQELFNKQLKARSNQ